jgi:hypothetical protein
MRPAHLYIFVAGLSVLIAAKVAMFPVNPAIDPSALQQVFKSQ